MNQNLKQTVGIKSSRLMWHWGMLLLVLFGLMVRTSATTQMAYVANLGDNTVSVISLDTLSAVATINVGIAPAYLAASPDGSRVYVLNESGTISVIDTVSGLVIDTVAVGSQLSGLAISRDGQLLYVLDYGSSTLSVIETTSDTIVATVPTAPAPTAIAVHPVLDELWVGYGQEGTVLEVRSALDYSVVATLTSFDRLYGSGFVFRPDGSEVFAAESCGFCGRFHLLSGSHSGGSISIIQPDILYDNTGSADGMAIHPVSGIVYLAKQGQNGTPYIREFGGAGRTLTFSTPPGQLAIAPDGERLYVTHFAQGFVSVVDTASLLPIATVNVGNFPWGITVVSTPPACVPPPAATITGPPSGALYAVGTSVSFTGSFAGDVQAAQWTFGNINQAGTVNQPTNSVVAAYTFIAAGVYAINLTVTDACGNAGSANTVNGLPAMVVVYDPNAGYVTGGGWFNSPAGAYVPQSTLTGKASFGFVSKYQKGASVPTGETEFQFKVANFDFHSVDYQWLVVSGARAQYKGTGTVNNAGTYGFILTAIDGQVNGGGGVDRFRIKIWDNSNNGAIVYDNQLGGSDSADPTTAIAGGSIVIHAN